MNATGGASRWSLTLYVNGASPYSAAALETVRRICDEELAGHVDLRIVDVAKDPAALLQDQIMAIPTLVKHLPVPERHLVGNLSDVERVRTGLDLAPPLPRDMPDSGQTR